MSSSAKFGRFLSVGLTNTVVGFLLFQFFLSALGFHYLIANVLVFVTWIWFGYELQRRWTFRAKASASSFGKYAVNQIAILGLATLLLWMLVHVLTLQPAFAYIVSMGVATAIQYFLTLLWVFREKSSGDRMLSSEVVES